MWRRLDSSACHGRGWGWRAWHVVWINQNGGVVSGLLTKDLFGARDRPPSEAEDERESSLQSPAPNQKEQDLEIADSLVQNVTQQNNGRPPPVEHQACTPDILLAHDCLQRMPPRCAGASFFVSAEPCWRHHRRGPAPSPGQDVQARQQVVSRGAGPDGAVPHRAWLRRCLPRATHTVGMVGMDINPCAI